MARCTFCSTDSGMTPASESRCGAMTSAMMIGATREER
jgi:hypothetical protein